MDGMEGASVLDRGPDLCGIVTTWIDGKDPRELELRLREEGIHTSSQSRDNAVLDYDSKGVSGALRLSPHAYNTEDEIDRALAFLRAI